MRPKDVLVGLYVFGEGPERCDLAYAGDDIVTGIRKSEAQELIALVDNLVDLLWDTKDELQKHDPEWFANRCVRIMHMRKPKGGA